jgi:regulator of CtrA degradation
MPFIRWGRPLSGQGRRGIELWETWVNEPDVIELDAAPARFGQNFVNSEAFKALFQEGMELVEETASYLDGAGRDDSRHLPRQAGLAYAGESMRLTTRLMQIASWLLLQRAVAEGELTSDQAQVEKNRVRLSSHDTSTSMAEFAALPERLKELIGLATRLHARILHLDRLIAEAEDPPQAPKSNPVAAQLGLLEKAFGPKD